MAFSETMEYAYFEGKFVPFKDANISIGTHALHYGTGAFAGIRGYLDGDGETINIFRLREHAARLLRSAKLLRMELPHDVDSVMETVLELTRRNAPTHDVYYRPLVYKSSVQLTPRLKGIADELAIYMMPMGDYLDTQRGQRVIVSSWTRITDNIIPARGKITEDTSTPRWPRTRPRRWGRTRRSCSTSTARWPRAPAATSSSCATGC